MHTNLFNYFDNMYNKAPIFKGKNFAYWKDNMHVHLMSVDKRLWITIKKRTFYSQKDFNDVFTIKSTKD